MFRRRIGLILFLNFFVICVGSAGYMIIEGWNFRDSVYMTVITIASVGYGEVNELSRIGRLFTIFLIIIGVSTTAASFTLLVDTLVNSDIQDNWRKRRMQNRLDKLNDHIVVCGYGRVGSNAVQVLHNEHKRHIVIIETNPALTKDINDAEIDVIVGDASQDDVLRQAGIERAWGLLTATRQDSLNLFVVLSARALNPNLIIVARTSQVENEEKMIRAGADRVVSPFDIGGKRMAHSLLRPHLTEFLDVLTGDGVELWLEELQINEQSSFLNQTVAEVDMRRRTGVTLLALLRSTRSEVITPSPTTKFLLNDDLIVIGTRQQLDDLEAIC